MEFLLKKDKYFREKIKIKLHLYEVLLIKDKTGVFQNTKRYIHK